jgi:SNF2 family DNA or RNA helicase
VTLELRISPERTGVEVRPGVGSRDEVVLQALRSADPPVRGRRVDGIMVVAYEDAVRLVDAQMPVPVETDAETARVLQNRARLVESADRVVAEARRRIGATADEARRLVADSNVAVTLDDHQVVNVAVMTVPNGWGTCIFDEQGTGKTPTTIAAFDVLVERGEAEVLVVVAPKSMVGEWAAEFTRFAGTTYQVAVPDGSRHQRALAIDSGADVVVVNYETVISLGESLRLLAQRASVVLAVDESFFVKNPDSARSRAVCRLREWCSRCFVLCGTPAPNSPHDLVAQFDLVDFGMTFSGVRLAEDRATAAGQVRVVLDARGLYVRNLKRTVLPHLPARLFTEVEVEMAPAQRAAYEAALNDLILDLTATSEKEFARSITSFLERRSVLLRICSDPAPLVPGYTEVPAKVEALDGILADLVENRREKTVVWSFYRSSLDRIADRYARYGVARIDGSIPDVAARRDAVRRFQDDDTTMIFLGNPAAAGAGLTLHRSRVAVYESLGNQAAHFLQSLDRIHRRGQEREVEYVTLLCRGTLEELEYVRLLDKADRQADLLGDPSATRTTRTLLLDELLTLRALLRAETP